MVTVTQKQYVTLCDPKMYPHTKFGIPMSNNIGYALDTIILELRPEVKDPKTVDTLGVNDAAI